MAIKLDASFAVNPGKWVRDKLFEPRGLTVSAAAQNLGVSHQAMSNFLNGRSDITAEIAVRLEREFGLKAAALLRMQAAHNLTQAPRREISGQSFKI